MPTPCIHIFEKNAIALEMTPNGYNVWDLSTGTPRDKQLYDITIKKNGHLQFTIHYPHKCPYGTSGTMITYSNWNSNYLVVPDHPQSVPVFEKGKRGYPLHGNTRIDCCTHSKKFSLYDCDKNVYLAEFPSSLII